MKKSLKRFFGYFKYSNFSKELAKLGASFSIRNLVITALVLIFCAVIAGFLMRLELQYCLILGITFLACLPSTLIAKFRMSFERKRFDDSAAYLEQMIYAFKKSGKIREALADVLLTSEGNVARCIRDMLNTIDYDKDSKDIYKKAFSIIEEDFGCHRMTTLHNFLIEIETVGGDPSRALDIMLDDIRAWAERVLLYQRSRKKSQSDVTLSIILAMFSCGLMINLMPDDYVAQIVPQLLYQLGTLAILMMCVFLYVISSNMVGKSYLDMEADTASSARSLRYMDYLMDYNKHDHIKPAIIKVVLFAPLLIGAIVLKKYWGIPMVAGMMLYFAFQAPMQKQKAVRSIIKEVNKTFPIWMRNMVLFLQTDNVHVSIQRSYNTCPRILQPELKKFIRGIAEDPISMKPYTEFLKDFDTPTLKLSVDYLYSLASFGAGDGLGQLDYLIEQNSKLSIAEEKIRNEEQLGGFSLMLYMPMVLAVLKLCLDMILMLSLFSGTMSSSMANINF